jgi:3-polyprenyl-4-hydroxybenzoate decarboxylase
MGGIIMPPVPAFYAQPKTLDDLVEHTVGRVLDLFGVRSAKVKRWQGLKGIGTQRLRKTPSEPD